MNTKVTELNFDGACCANGIIRAKKAIAKVPGTGKATIDLARHVVRVEGEFDPQAVVKVLTDEGFEASINV